jgi:integrase
MITTDIVWDHRKRTKAGSEGPLEVRLTIDRKPYYINTGIKVRRNEFKAGMIVNRPDADTLRARLNIIYHKIEAEINAAINEGRKIDVADIKRQAWVLMEDESSSSFLEWCCEQVAQMTHSEGTLQHYQTMLSRLYDFDTIRRWKDITVENVCKWDAYLHTIAKPQSDGDKKAGKPVEYISDGAIFNYHKCLKALLNRAVLFDRLQQNPYDRLRGKFKRGDRERIDYLTDEEMETFESLHPVAGSKMAMARDLFVLQMYTGLSYSDTQDFDIGDYKLIDGVWRNTGERIKTGVAYVSQLLPPVVEILERYNWQVPRLDNSDYNMCLKALGMACGIERPLHSHMARHTFATWMLRHGVFIEHVSKMLGHTNITQTQRYAKIVAADIHDDFDRVAKLIKNNPKNKKI